MNETQRADSVPFTTTLPDQLPLVCARVEVTLLARGQANGQYPYPAPSLPVTSSNPRVVFSSSRSVPLPSTDAVDWYTILATRWMAYPLSTQLTMIRVAKTLCDEGDRDTSNVLACISVVCAMTLLRHSQRAERERTVSRTTRRRTQRERICRVFRSMYSTTSSARVATVRVTRSNPVPPTTLQRQQQLDARTLDEFLVAHRVARRGCKGCIRRRTRLQRTLRTRRAAVRAIYTRLCRSRQTLRV